MCVDFAGPVLHHEKHKTQSGVTKTSSILFTLACNKVHVTADIYIISRGIYSP